MRDLTISLIQSDLAWENPSANLFYFEDAINTNIKETDLIILPEMFSTGFSMNVAQCAENMAGKTVQWMKDQAHNRRIDITGSVMISENERFYNRLIWANCRKEIAAYDKKHLFKFAGEEKVFSPGDRHLTVTLNGWHIRPFVCYDLRFPIWTRNLDSRYDLALFVANWPQKRANHWRSLLIARAIENQCYVVGVNRIGVDGNQLAYSGDSLVVSPNGDIVYDAKCAETVASVTLSATKLKHYRKTFPVLTDADMDMVVSNQPVL